MLQKSNTILLPELGLNLEPEFLKEIHVDTEFSRVIAHVVGQTGARSIMIRATSDGRLHVASGGVSFEWMEVQTDNAPDAWNVAQTYEYAQAVMVTDFDLEDFAAEFQFRNHSGIWGPTKRLRVGISSIDFVHYGVRIRNRVGASVSAFQITVYR